MIRKGKNNPNHKGKSTIWRIVGYYMTFGFELAFCLIIGLSIGLYIQGTFDWKPWGLLFGLGLGFGAMVITFLRISRRIKKNEDL